MMLPERKIRRRWSIVFVSIILYILALGIRFYGLDRRVWFELDASRNLLYAWNIVHYHEPLLIGPVTSGSTFPNPPIFLNFLALLMWVCGSNPIITVYAFTALATCVVPLFFFLGVIEGSWTAGVIAALAYAFSPGAIDMTNTWEPFLAIIFGMIGIVLFRLSKNNKYTFLRSVALVILCIAGTIHFSYIAFLIALLLYELLKNKDLKRFFIDVGISLTSFFFLLLPMLYSLYSQKLLAFPEIRYSNGTCLYCFDKIPDLFGSTVSWFFYNFFFQQYGRQILSAVGVVVILIGFIERKKILLWPLSVSLIVLFFAWLFAGQTAYWYLLVLVPCVFMFFGTIIANGLQDKHLGVRIAAFGTVLVFYFFSFRSLVQYYYDSTSRFQTIIDVERIVRDAAMNNGILASRYVEYANLNNFTVDEFPETTALWLVRQWQFDNVMTWNDTVNNYNPAPLQTNSFYKLYICRNCDVQASATLFQNEGYVYDRVIGPLEKDLWMYVYIMKMKE